MGENVESNYTILMKEMKEMKEMEDSGKKAEIELFKNINKKIDEILLKTSNKTEMLKALICVFEGNSATSSYYAQMSIVYALLCCVSGIQATIVSFTDSCDINFYLLIFVGLFLCFIGMMMVLRVGKDHKTEQNRAFILNVLRFKYETINNEIVDNEKEASTDDEDIGQYKQYTVKVRLRN